MPRPIRDPAAASLAVRSLKLAAGLAFAALAVTNANAQPVAPGQAQPAPVPPGYERVYWDTLTDNGELTGGVALIRTTARPAPDVVIKAPVSVMHQRDAASTNRLNIVCVGDGYQAGELPLFAVHAQDAINRFLAQEPFKTYAPLINVFRVDVVSQDSGVDNDPVQGVSRNTALDMAYWCGGTERLLCVNVTKAYSYANNSPLPPDQVLAIANSSMYGGAGYPGNDLGTLAGANSSAAEIAIHEMGHSLGNLADEYDYGGPATYAGGEPADANASKLNAAAMAAAGAKWARWLGFRHTSFDGLIDSYEGAVYSRFGIYRPTNNSKMRNLGRPFNLPSAEALIIEIYKKVRPIDNATSTAAPLPRDGTVFVDPVDPVGNPLAIQWSLDGVDIPGATAATLDLCPIEMTPGTHILRVKVVDNTFMVRDQAARDRWMTQTRSWLIVVGPRPADINQDGVVDFADYLEFLTLLEAMDPRADVNQDGVTDFADYLEFLNQYGEAC